MSERKEVRFCWVIHVYTRIQGKVLKIVASLNSDVYEATNPVIEGLSIKVYNSSRFSPRRGVSMKRLLSKDVSTRNGDL